MVQEESSNLVSLAGAELAPIEVPPAAISIVQSELVGCLGSTLSRSDDHEREDSFSYFSNQVESALGLFRP